MLHIELYAFQNGGFWKQEIFLSASAVSNINVTSESLNKSYQMGKQHTNINLRLYQTTPNESIAGESHEFIKYCSCFCEFDISLETIINGLSCNPLLELYCSFIKLTDPMVELNIVLHSG